MSKNEDKIYCGINNIPVGKRRGTAEECFKANQIRWWGIRGNDEYDTSFMKERDT